MFLICSFRSFNCTGKRLFRVIGPALRVICFATQRQLFPGGNPCRATTPDWQDSPYAPQSPGSQSFSPPRLPLAQITPAKALKIPELKYEKYTLPNGLVVITHEDHRLPLVAVDLWYHVGPLNERAGRTGFAHLFEHMMFEGSEHVGEKAHIKFVQGAGATDVNGTTSFDRTNYFETMPSNQLELALWLESDRMGFLMEGLDRVKLANQRDVVRNERRQGEGRPYDVADEEVYHLIFPKSHPYYASVIGSHADIEAARIADIRDFHQQFYTPNNASIAIAGDFDPEEAEGAAHQVLRPNSAGPEGRARQHSHASHHLAEALDCD